VLEQRAIRLLLKGVNELLGVANGLELLGLLVGDFHAEGLLEVEDELHQVERVRVEVIDESGAFCDLQIIPPKGVQSLHGKKVGQIEK